jgi:fatty-acyl-CoA synthase
MPAGMYDRDLDKCAANYVPLTPLSFLERAAAVYPDKTAVIHGEHRYSYREFRDRCHRLASALTKAGVGVGDTVAVLSPNIPATLEAHYGVPMAGAVLNAQNTRLDAATVAFCLNHAQAKVFIVEREWAPIALDALAKLERKPLLVEVNDAEIQYAAGAAKLGGIDYEEFLAGGDPGFAGPPLTDEWQAISLNYTSGTTGDPKGVVYHHRGAYLNAIGDILTCGLNRQSVYLWTLPMFHCNGWCFTWGVTAACGTHVCLRKIDPAVIYPMIKHHSVTHMCGAPIIMNVLANAPASVKIKFDRQVEIITGGAAPPSAIIEAMESSGFHVTHMYGLTETYGPATVCAWQSEWDGMALTDRSRKMARQGVPQPTLEAMMVADPETMAPVPADGATIGELMLRSNTVVKGYLKNPKATVAAFRGGWFHTGDLAVCHPDGYVEIKDRSKDIIISGGENISSLEIEETLYRHPKVLEAAVVARPDDHWGETPCAFITLRNEADCSAEEIITFCRSNMAHFKAPRTVVFGPLPKTSTGKIQKFVLREQAKNLSPAQ